MRNVFKITAIILSLYCFSFTAYAADEGFKGVWVSSVFNLDYPSVQGLSAESLKKEADNIISNTAEMGLNAIILQVRPCGDSLYKSKIFPWSAYISGTQGIAPPDDFDPLAYFIKQAHAKNIEIHAWCNPYRVTKTPAKTREEGLSTLSANNPARLNPQNVIFHTDGNLYYDPGLPANRTLITQGILEIVENYDVDGIHLDDYFYPGTDFNDAASFAQFGKDFKSIDDFRRNSVDLLIENLYNSIKSIKQNVAFGVSPFGIWANKSSLPQGSDTIGGQSYFQHYADTKKWVETQILDYICPQLYWHVGAAEGEFQTLLSWWQSTVKNTKVKLYVGLGAYRLQDASADSPWYGTDMLTRQISLADAQSDGVVFFRYKSLSDNLALKTMLPSALKNPQPAKAYTLAISRPDGNIKTMLNRFYVTGTSDISKPLTINGATVEGRSMSGFFGVSVPLIMGENNLIFTNGDSTTELTITRGLSSPFVCTANATGQIIVPEGVDIPLSCTADPHAEISVSIGGKFVQLKNYFDGTFRASLKLPAGQYKNPVYYIRQGQVIKPVFSVADITVLPKNTGISAVVTAPYCDIYPTYNPAFGADGFLKQGMSFNVEHVVSNMAYIPRTGYVPLEDIAIYYDKIIPPASVKKIETAQIGSSMTVNFLFDCVPAAKCAVEDGKLRLWITPFGAPVIFSHDFFPSVTAEKCGDAALYTLALKPDYKLGGVDIVPTEKGFQLVISPKAKPASGLTGIKILLDPGHGGNANGAMGADPDYPEKRGNLDMALELEKQLKALGAEVIMTRKTDISVDLSTRMAQIITQKPHVFLSLHSNSAADDVNIGERSGVELYLRGNLAQPLADILQIQVEKTGSTCRQNTDNKLYMCRSTVCPSILLENEYIPNPAGLEKIMSPAQSAALCAAVCESLVDYFSEN